MQKTLKFLGFILIGLTLSTSCSSDDSSPVSNEESLLTNKWWYSADGTVSDLYFYSNGDYKQTFTGFGQTLNSTGKWEWVNQATGIIRVYDLVGNGTTEYYTKVSNLTADILKIKISFDGGQTYSNTLYNYQDTDN